MEVDLEEMEFKKRNVDKVGWLCNTKYILLMFCEALKMVCPYDCGKRML
jgi:hypothetical protein